MKNDTDRRMPPDMSGWLRHLLEEEGGRVQTARELRQQMDGLERLLQLKERSRVLDMGCGSGRQTIELARRGHRVLGMDISPSALAATRAAVRGQRLNVHFQAGDMRRIPYAEEFDAVINLQHPLGCFPSERDDLQCLSSVRKSLKVGGLLLLDLVNREWLVVQLSRRPGPTAETAFDLRTGRLDCRWLIPAGEVRPAVLGDSLRVYSLTEIERLLEAAGLELRRVCGDFDGGPYVMGSPRMIVLAEKPPQPDRARRDDGLPRALRIKGRPR